MNLEEAKKILDDTVQPNGDLYCPGHYISWHIGDKDICLDCNFSVDELEAIVVYMRANNK